MRRQFLFFSMLSVMGGIAHAQSIYTYVQQNGEKLGQLGTASFEVNADSNPTVEFVDGKAVMTIGNNKVASLPMSHGGELVVEWTTTLDEGELNRLTKSPTDLRPFATIYSPFQLVVPEGSDVYAPSFDPSSNLLYLGNKLAAGDCADAARYIHCEFRLFRCRCDMLPEECAERYGVENRCACR